jgi:hypothetical protein
MQRWLGLLVLVLPAIALGDVPALDGDRSYQCLRDGKGLVWRVQFDTQGKRLLYAPDSEVAEDGSWIAPLERTRPCYPEGGFDVEALRAQGFTLQRAVADAPFGWMRDERGRVFQVSFDLHRRLYVGAGFAPELKSPDAATPPARGRAYVDFALFIYERLTKGAGIGMARHRLRLGEGRIHIAPFAARAVFFHYDVSIRHPKPLLRLTTFFGKPRRHDARMNLGFWLEGGDVEIHDSPSGQESLYRFGTVNATADLWQSPDLTSFVRLRTGAGVEGTYVDALATRQAITPMAAVDADFTLDRRGMHHLVGGGVAEAPQYTSSPRGGRTRARRVKAALSYEGIFLAVNDQPLTLFVEAGASWRDDIAGVTPAWALSATAGLRFSLWAPARQRTGP